MIEKNGNSPKEFIGSVKNAMAVLSAFDDNHPKLTLSETAEITGMTRAMARRYLITLVELGYVYQQGRNFSLTSKVLKIGYAFLANMSLKDIAQPYLDMITKQSGESCGLGILDEEYIVHIANSTSDKIIVPSVILYKRFPVLYTSIGRLLISYKNNKEIEQYIENNSFNKYTDKTIVTNNKFMEEINMIRRNEYAIIDQELEVGLRSVAVPIKDSKDLPIAGINIVTNAFTVPKKQLLNECIPILIDASEKITNIMKSIIK